MSALTIEEVLRLLDRNEALARDSINMVPSEASTSPLAKLPLLLDVYHRYFFNDRELPTDWHFRGSQAVSSLETRLSLVLLRELTGAAFVNLRPLSGLNGMTLILSGLAGPPGSTVMCLSLEQGGHYATVHIAKRLGLQTCLITGPDPHTIDYDGVARTLELERPGLVYVDQSNSLFPLDIARLVEVVREVAPGTLVHMDVSQWLGLVLGRQFPHPLELGADSFGGSTHKTFPGPQKAIFATNREDLAEQVHGVQMFMISSHHFAASIALGIALLEFKECGGEVYARRVVENTRLLGAELTARGLAVEAADRGFSAGHQLWIRTAPTGIDAFEASDRLYESGLRVNAFPFLPGIREPVIRIGVNEATYHGLTEADVPELADIFTAAVFDRAPTAKLAARTAALRRRYRLPYAFDPEDPALSDLVASIVSRVLAADPFPERVPGADGAGRLRTAEPAARARRRPAPGRASAAASNRSRAK